MNARSLFLLTSVASLLGCPGKEAAAPQPAPASQPATAPASQPASAPSAEVITYPLHRGAAFEVAEETALTAIIEAPKDFGGKKLKTRGTIARACTKKGCWMELKAEGKDQGVRVTFKDYGFFVPTDSAGATAVVEGEVSVNTLDKETAEHLEGEGAHIVRNEAGDAVEIAFLAHGVELTR